MVELHSLKASQRRYKIKRVGRGNSSGKGTTAGRGTKGQRARTGGRNKLTRRGLKALFERTPKTRGFRSRTQKKSIVNLRDLERLFETGKIISPDEMLRAGLIQRGFRGVKVIGRIDLKKKFTIKADGFSQGAEAAITKAGGSAVRLGKPASPAS